MIHSILQPYRNLEIHHIQAFKEKKYYFWVSQSYHRARNELDHTKTPILFTPYKDLVEANKHYHQIKDDTLAAIADINKNSHLARLVNLCNGNSDKVPYISLTFNQQHLDMFIFRHYYNTYRAWVRKNRTDWILKEHNAVDAHFQTLMGEPAVRITYGKQFVVVRLEELEKM